MLLGDFQAFEIHQTSLLARSWYVYVSVLLLKKIKAASLTYLANVRRKNSKSKTIRIQLLATLWAGAHELQMRGRMICLPLRQPVTVTFPSTPYVEKRDAEILRKSGSKQVSSLSPSLSLSLFQSRLAWKLPILCTILRAKTTFWETCL